MLNRLERQVNDALAHEDATQALARLIRGIMIERYGSDPRRADVIEQHTDAALAFIRTYVANTPAVIRSMMEASSDAGVSDDLMPVFVAADDYFLQAVDFIPDHLGLVGLLDDSYMVQALVQRICDAHFSRTQVRLLTFNLTPANTLVRHMIGEPMATALDATVRHVMELPDVQTARERLERCVARLKMRLADPYTTCVCPFDDLDLHLGALGTAPDTRFPPGFTM